MNARVTSPSGEKQTCQKPRTRKKSSTGRRRPTWRIVALASRMMGWPVLRGGMLLKVLHTIGSLDMRLGGSVKAVADPVRYEAGDGLDVTLAGTRDMDDGLEYRDSDLVPVHCHAG